MDYRVIKFFIDHDSLKEFNAGDLFPCADEERAAKLIYKGYIERIQPVKEEPKEPKKTTARAKSTVKKTASKKKA